MNKSDFYFEAGFTVDWSRVRRVLETALEAVAVIWVLTSFSFQSVIPVYQWY